MRSVRPDRRFLDWARLHAAPRSVTRIGSSLGLLAQALGFDTPGAPERRRLAIRAGRKLARAARGTALQRAEKSRLSPAEIDDLLAWLASDPDIPDGVRIRDAANPGVRRYPRPPIGGCRVEDGGRPAWQACGSLDQRQPAGMLFLARSKSEQEARETCAVISPATVSAVESWIEFAELNDEDAPLSSGR